MINFRYHLVSIAAIFLALAVGVALGSGPLDNAKSLVGDDPASTASTSLGDLASFDSAYATKTAPALVNGKLKGQSVLIVTAPGARADDVRGLKSAMLSGGAVVTTQLALASKLLDSANRQFAEGVAQQSAQGASDVVTSGDSYAVIGSALARAYLGQTPGAVDTAGNTIAAAFAEGKLASTTEKPTRRASLVLIVVGPTPPSGDQGQAGILAQLAVAFDAQAKGVVVAGPSQSSEDGGYLQVLRSSAAAAKVSSIDVAESPAGRWLTVLVAARELADNAGAFGTARSADGPFPR